MKVEMKMPDLSTASTTVKVIRWLVEKGQSIQRGQPILEVETDKATMDVEAYTSGVLGEILVSADTDVEVGQVIGIIDTTEEITPLSKPDAVQTTPAPLRTPVAKTPPTTEQKSGGMFARNRQKAAQQAVEIKPIETMSVAQRVVGQRMQESKQTIPHFYLQTSANAEPMIARRNTNPGEKPVWDAFFVSAVGIALKQYPRMCYNLIDGKLTPQTVDAVGVAVDLDGDLYVVQATNPASKTPEQISVEIRGMVQRLRNGDQEARKIRANNITITNLGASGVESFTAIINPPEAAILAIGKIAPVVATEDGKIFIQNRVSLTLSVDHRIVNGRYAADFLEKIVHELETLGGKPL